MDHGILNVPLSKRGSGSIDAQLDRFKAQQARDAKVERKARAEQNRKDKAQAKALFAEVGETLIGALVARGVSKKDAKQELHSLVTWQPSKFIGIATRFKTERNL